MRYCNKCKVTIENDTINCPLCNQETAKISNRFEDDFPMEMDRKRANIIMAKKVLIFIFIFLLCLNLLLDILLSTKIVWAPYCIVLLIYAYIIINLGIKSYRTIGTIVMSSVFMASIISIILDVFLGFEQWSFNYAIPFSILAGILALFIFICIKPVYFLSYLVCMFIIAFFGLALIVFLFTGLVSIKMPSIITVFTSFMSIVAMFMFGDRDIKNELTKRFHF